MGQAPGPSAQSSLGGVGKTASGLHAAAAAAAAVMLAAVHNHVRLSAQVPQLLAWPTRPRWSLQAAAAELLLASEQSAAGLSTNTVSKGAAGQPPPPEALCRSEHDARRLAAVLLLQRRLPVLLHRRRLIMTLRGQLTEWVPWLAHLHTLLARLAAEAAAALLPRGIMQEQGSGLMASLISESKTEQHHLPAEFSSETAAAAPASPGLSSAAASRPASAMQSTAAQTPRGGMDRGPSDATLQVTTWEGKSGHTAAAAAAAQLTIQV